MSKVQTITPELQQLISTTVVPAVTAMAQEMRKPSEPTPQEQANLAQAQEERRANAESVKQKNANRRWMQEHGCTHFHKPNDAGGGTHCTFVYDNGIAGSPGFIYCQKCEARIRPDEPLMRRLDPEALFSTAKFNELIQTCAVPG